MAQLRLARSKFAKHLGQRARLEAAAQQFVQFARARSQLNDLRTFLVELGGRGEAHRHEFRRLHQDLVGLRLGDALNGEQMLLGRIRNRLDRVEAGLLQFLDVACRDANALENVASVKTQNGINFPYKLTSSLEINCGPNSSSSAAASVLLDAARSADIAIANS